MQIYDGRETFYQWDLNQRITSNEFKVGDEIHFFNIKQGNASVVIAYELDGKIVADVPNILLQSSYPITVYHYVNNGENARTINEYSFEVKQRAKPTDYIYTETEILNYKEIDSRLKKLENNEIANAVSYSQSQDLTDEQKQTARTNIDALSVDDVDNVIHDALNKAIESGEFDGKDGVSVTHEWNGTVLTVTSASGTSSADLKGEKGDKGNDGADGKDGTPATHKWDGTVLTVTSASGTSSADLKGEKGDKGDKGEDGADYILTDDDKREIATKANAVSYSVTQNLTDEQKQTARENIDAVSQTELDEKIDASLVVSNIISDTGSLLSDNIPNGDAVVAFVREHGVLSSQVQSLSKGRKARARQNIDVDGGKWELLYTIEGDGKTKVWEYNQFANGSSLKLTAVSAVIIQDVAEAENSYGFLNAYSGDKMTQVSGAIYSYFTKNSAPTTSGTQRAYAVVEQHRGQYRAYSSGMVAKNAEVLRYASYMQAKYTTADYPYIDRIKVQKQTGVFSAGNKIEVYGVRYYG